MDIFEVHILGNNKKILYFGKERANDKQDGIENIYTSKFISLDDTIQTIKNKILEVLNYDITYEELYLFSKRETNISKDDLYNVLIQDNDSYIDLETYLNFLIVLGIFLSGKSRVTFSLFVPHTTNIPS